MRRSPPPLSVTRPPPSSTTSGPWSLRTLAVAFMAIVTGAGPQSKVITPPAATAATTAADVQLAGVPLPTTRSGRRVSTARASAGTAASPSGLPGLGRAFGVFDGRGLGLALGPRLGAGTAGPDAAVDAAAGAGADEVGATSDDGGAGGSSSAQPDRARAQVTVRVIASG